MAQRPGHYGNWSGSIWKVFKYGAGGEWRSKMIREREREREGERESYRK